MPQILEQEELSQLIEICKRIRGESESVWLTSFRDAMLAAGCRRQLVAEVIRTASKMAEKQYDQLDDNTVRIALEGI